MHFINPHALFKKRSTAYWKKMVFDNCMKNTLRESI